MDSWKKLNLLSSLPTTNIIGHPAPSYTSQIVSPISIPTSAPSYDVYRNYLPASSSERILATDNFTHPGSSIPKPLSFQTVSSLTSPSSIIIPNLPLSSSLDPASSFTLASPKTLVTVHSNDSQLYRPQSTPSGKGSVIADQLEKAVDTKHNSSNGDSKLSELAKKLDDCLESSKRTLLVSNSIPNLNVLKPSVDTPPAYPDLKVPLLHLSPRSTSTSAQQYSPGNIKLSPGQNKDGDKRFNQTDEKIDKILSRLAGFQQGSPTRLLISTASPKKNPGKAGSPRRTADSRSINIQDEAPQANDNRDLTPPAKSVTSKPNPAHNRKGSTPAMYESPESNSSGRKRKSHKNKGSPYKSEPNNYQFKEELNINPLPKPLTVSELHNYENPNKKPLAVRKVESSPKSIPSNTPTPTIIKIESYPMVYAPNENDEQRRKDISSITSIHLNEDRPFNERTLSLTPNDSKIYVLSDSTSKLVDNQRVLTPTRPSKVTNLPTPKMEASRMEKSYIDDEIENSFAKAYNSRKNKIVGEVDSFDERMESDIYFRRRFQQDLERFMYDFKQRLSKEEVEELYKRLLDDARKRYLRETKFEVEKQEHERSSFFDYKKMTPEEKDRLYDRLISDARKRQSIKLERERLRQAMEEEENRRLEAESLHQKRPYSSQESAKFVEKLMNDATRRRVERETMAHLRLIEDIEKAKALANMRLNSQLQRNGELRRSKSPESPGGSPLNGALSSHQIRTRTTDDISPASTKDTPTIVQIQKKTPKQNSSGKRVSNSAIRTEQTPEKNSGKKPNKTTKSAVKRKTKNMVEIPSKDLEQPLTLKTSPIELPIQTAPFDPTEKRLKSSLTKSSNMSRESFLLYFNKEENLEVPPPRRSQESRSKSKDRNPQTLLQATVASTMKNNLRKSSSLVKTPVLDAALRGPFSPKGREFKQSNIPAKQTERSVEGKSAENKERVKKHSQNATLGFGMMANKTKKYVSDVEAVKYVDSLIEKFKMMSKVA